MADLISNLTKLSINSDLSNTKNKFPELTTEEKAIGAQFETLSKRFTTETENLNILNDSLRSKTFMVGNKPSESDLIVFKNIYPVVSEWKLDDSSIVAEYRHILRWVDLIQNLLITVESPIKINFEIEIPREIKEKKKPTKEATPDNKKEVSPKDSKDKDAKSAGAPPVRKELTEEERAKKKAEKEAKKAAKAKQNQAKEANNGSTAQAPNPGLIDFRVGFIEKAEKHPNADSLYMSTINMGDEEGPRIVCSGLVNYIPIEEMQKRYVICVANLKPVTMRGVKSCAMVLCASTENKVEFVNPPEGSTPGDKIFFEGFNQVPEKQLNPKKKIWEACQPKFSTNENFEVTYTEEGKEPVKLVNEKGQLCKNSTIVKADVK
ncbi:unnamed protein product [Candida verbasci]|uniref:tRNA-binding domain-containing protein n=1 Tax=Candida verbasci TaxID=1227364 RepID=A0A9W4TQ75_9ASCO|nr:unnamed protein product [Candida verbasci]